MACLDIATCVCRDLTRARRSTLSWFVFACWMRTSSPMAHPAAHHTPWGGAAHLWMVALASDTRQDAQPRTCPVAIPVPALGIFCGFRTDRCTGRLCAMGLENVSSLFFFTFYFSSVLMKTTRRRLRSRSRPTTACRRRAGLLLVQGLAPLQKPVRSRSGVAHCGNPQPTPFSKSKLSPVAPSSRPSEEHDCVRPCDRCAIRPPSTLLFKQRPVASVAILFLIKS